MEKIVMRNAILFGLFVGLLSGCVVVKVPSSGQAHSIQITNTCTKDVRLFSGKEPKTSDGQYFTVSPSASTSKTLKNGDSLWIVDTNGNGVSSIEIASSMSSAKINTKCSGFIVN